MAHFNFDSWGIGLCGSGLLHQIAHDEKIDPFESKVCKNEGSNGSKNNVKKGSTRLKIKYNLVQNALKWSHDIFSEKLNQH